jgi:cytokinesis protein
MEQSLSGRGKMGSLVGASEEVKRAGGIDSSLNDYAVRPSAVHTTLIIHLSLALM